MRPVIAFFLVCACFFQVSGQSSRLAMKRGKMRGFAAQIAESVLVIPIEDEKDPEEKALMAAVKKYWKVSKFEFVPDKEFEAVFTANLKEQKNCMYLIRESYDRRKRKKKDWSFTKYYLSLNPSFAEVWGDPYLQFKLPVTAVDRREAKQVNCDYIYGLMMKHLNREVGFMKEPDKYGGRVSKRSLYKATFYGSLEQYADRDILVSRKELDNFMMNLRDEKKTREQEAGFINYLGKRLKAKPGKIRLVSDDYIKKAIEAEDKNVLVYTGFSLFKPEDAGMLRRIDPHRSNRIAFNITFTISLFVAIAAFLAGLTYF